MINISILLASYKRSDILNNTLRSFIPLLQSSLSWELVVVDNANDPQTAEVIKFWQNKLPVSCLIETTPGKNNALNCGLSAVQGELVVLTDDDIIATPDWLDRMWEGAQRWKNHFVFGGRVLPAWPDGYRPLDLENPFLVSALAVANWAIPEGEYLPEKVFGPNMAVRREIFEQGWRFNGNVGPSQKKFYTMGSETEFLLRLAEAGYMPVYLPDVLVYHQIRPEQLSLHWLKERAYRAGYGVFEIDEVDDQLPKLFGIPRYILKIYSISFFRSYFSRFFNPNEHYEVEMRLANARGKIDWFLKNSKRKSHVSG